MSNRNFDNTVIIQRLQNQTYARNLYKNNTEGKKLINNPQNSDGNSSRYNTYISGAQTEYFRGVLGNGETISIGGIVNIPPYPTAITLLMPGSMSFNYERMSSVQYTNTDSLTIGTQSFTIEWYQYWQSGAEYPRIFSIGKYPDANIALSYEQGQILLWINNNNNNTYSTIAFIPPIDEWSHIAIVGTLGECITLYVNGSEIGNFFESYNIINDTSKNLTIGNETDPDENVASYTGLITNFRWVVGTAIYTSNFTPPSIPLTNITGTQLLLVTNQTKLVVDSSDANRTPINNNVSYSSSLPSTLHSYAFVTDGLSLYYNFGNIDSYSGSGTNVTSLSPIIQNTGNLINSPTYNSTWNGVLVLDGINNYIDSNASFASESFTINAWFKSSNDVTNYRMIISKEPNNISIPWNYRMYLDINSGFLIGDIVSQASQPASIIYDTNLADNNWHCASFSRDATTNKMKLYVDGVLVNEQADGLVGPISNDQNVWIGYSALYGGSYPFNGTIGSTFIYNRALTDNEILDNYIATRVRFFPCPVLTVPLAPTINNIISGNGQLTLNFTAGNDGGSPIINYEYSINNGSSWTARSPSSTNTPITISGLANSTSYSVKIRAINIIGNGDESNMVSGTPVGNPSAPTNLIGTGGNQQITVLFTPGVNGGSPITNYQYSTDNGATFITFNPPDMISPVTITTLSTDGITPLTNNTTYSIKLKAVTAIGLSPESSSINVTPLDPGTPILTYILSSDQGAYVYFTITSTTSILNYEWSQNGGVTNTELNPADTVSPLYIPNLTNNVPAIIQIRSVDINGIKSNWSNTLSVIPSNNTVPTSQLFYDPNNTSSYSGTGTNVFSIGAVTNVTGTKGANVLYQSDSTISRNVFNFSGANTNANTNVNLITFPIYDFGNTITVTAWIYPRIKANINGLLVNTTANVNPNGFKFQWNTWLTDSRVIGMQAGNGTQGADNYSVTNTITYDEWQHIGYIFDKVNRTVVFFKNGVPVDMATSITPVANIGTNQAFNIGGYIGGSYTMNANLGYIKVFNTLLSASEILSDYNNTKSQFGL
jgi:hypothetical protein